MLIHNNKRSCKGLCGSIKYLPFVLPVEAIEDQPFLEVGVHRALEQLPEVKPA